MYNIDICLFISQKEAGYSRYVSGWDGSHHIQRMIGLYR